MDLQVTEAVHAAEPSPTRKSATGALEKHVGLLHGATSVGEAARREHCVRVGLWMDESGWIRSARWRSAQEPLLRAYAEVACRLIESGADPLRIDGALLRGTIDASSGEAEDYSELVVSAVRTAMMLAPSR